MRSTAATLPTMERCNGSLVSGGLAENQPVDFSSLKGKTHLIKFDIDVNQVPNNPQTITQKGSVGLVRLDACSIGYLFDQILAQPDALNSCSTG